MNRYCARHSNRTFTASPYIVAKGVVLMMRRNMDFGTAARMITCPRKGTSDHAPLAPSISRAHAAVRVEAASALVSMSSISRMIISRLSDAQSRSMLHSESSGSYRNGQAIDRAAGLGAHARAGHDFSRHQAPIPSSVVSGFASDIPAYGCYRNVALFHL